jgi:hypothetical protein
MENVMKWALMSKAAKVIAMGMTLASCGMACGSDASAQVNRPLANAEVVTTLDVTRVRQIVRQFASRNNFAVQENLIRPRGNAEFFIRLFRDDISVSVIKLVGDPISVTANALCVCELGNRTGLRDGAESAVRELQADLSH